jgi:hypothetical protein
MIHHKFFNQLEAGEATRGYLHGGLLIDFIGQKAPISVVRLLLSDLLVLFLNLVMLGLIVERVKTTEVTASAPATSGVIETPSDQDHDSEERGVLRNNTAEPTSDGIELNELRPHDEHTDISMDEQSERTELLADPSENGLVSGARNNHALDTFSSGEAVVMDLGLFDIIRDQWRYNPAAARRTSSFIPSDQTASFLRERFGLQVNADGRLERIST